MYDEDLGRAKTWAAVGKKVWRPVAAGRSVSRADPDRARGRGGAARGPAAPARGSRCARRESTFIGHGQEEPAESLIMSLMDQIR